MERFLKHYGEEVYDAEEETFLLLTSGIPSQDLGMVDSQARSVEITVSGTDLVIQQDPSVLMASQGTTGAVLWRLSPLIADWLVTPGPFSQSGLLDSNSKVIELGAGMSGVLPIVLGPRVGRYIATDQAYVLKTLQKNLDLNLASTHSASKGDKKHNRKREKLLSAVANARSRNISTMALDWELDAIDDLPRLLRSADDYASENASDNMPNIVIACDCIYNEALVGPFVQTCAKLCKLRKDTSKPTFCLIAQQLRSPDVLQEWLSAMIRQFRIWRLTDDALSEQLKSGCGFVVHLAILRSDGEAS